MNKISKEICPNKEKSSQSKNCRNNISNDNDDEMPNEPVLPKSPPPVHVPEEPPPKTHSLTKDGKQNFDSEESSQDDAYDEALEENETGVDRAREN